MQYCLFLELCLVFGILIFGTTSSSHSILSCLFTLFPTLYKILSVIPYHYILTLKLDNLLQLLLVQDGKLYGRYPILAVIIRAARLPEVIMRHDIQKNEYVVQLGQVKTIVICYYIPSIT